MRTRAETRVLRGLQLPREQVLLVVKDESSQTVVGRRLSAPSNERRLPENVKNSGATKVRRNMKRILASFARSGRLGGRLAAHCATAVSEFESTLRVKRHPWAQRARRSRSRRIGSSLHPISSNLFCVRDPRTATCRHTHFQLEALCASGPILWC